jgi:hypothetical protein
VTKQDKISQGTTYGVLSISTQSISTPVHFHPRLVIMVQLCFLDASGAETPDVPATDDLKAMGISMQTLDADEIAAYFGYGDGAEPTPDGGGKAKTAAVMALEKIREDNNFSYCDVVDSRKIPDLEGKVKKGRERHNAESVCGGGVVVVCFLGADCAQSCRSSSRSTCTTTTKCDSF